MKFISYDLGTGGVKASLYDEDLTTLAKSFIEYNTFYPGPNMREQRPDDWWKSVVKSTGVLLEKSKISASEIQCIALSGQSLVAIPLDRNLEALCGQVPIWSDTRASGETKEFFKNVDEQTWYMTTGNGFPAPCYPVFKLMWLKKHAPELFSRIYKVVGSKDYINLKLTGEICTDYSYASGTGAYDLKESKIIPQLLSAAGLPEDIFPEIVPSHRTVGRITAKAAREIGLPEGTAVACGGVDNACMALGAVGSAEGKAYTSLGSSSWISVVSRAPLLDPTKKPYVFAHIEEGMFTSAFSIFSGGSSLRWIRDVLCKDLADNNQAYSLMDQMAEQVPAGSNGILFNPSLAGGTSQDKSVNIRGAFIGLHLGTTRADMIRAAMEGIALNLKISLNYLKEHTEFSNRLMFCGGGSKSKFWMQMFADIFEMEVVKTNIDQDAASIGAAAIAARSSGLWGDYAKIESLHQVESCMLPQKENVGEYRKLQTVFEHVSGVIADLGDYMARQTNQ